jgi:hypothetical protein
MSDVVLEDGVRRQEFTAPLPDESRSTASTFEPMPLEFVRKLL